MTRMQIGTTYFRKAVLSAAICGALALGCSADQQETERIVDNLIQAGFPKNDIQIVDGQVYTGRDALVTLQASREMLQTGKGTEEQYRTNNLVSSSIRSICVRPSDTFGDNAALMTGLHEAVSNYNALPLRFAFIVDPNLECDAYIDIALEIGTGGVAGFPSDGLPYGAVYIGDGIPMYGSGVTRHVIEHELGHCIGFRHSDYYDRRISCGADTNVISETDDDAILVPGTPSTAVHDGSVYNSCYNYGSTGTFTSSDVTALTTIYPAPPPPSATFYINGQPNGGLILNANTPFTLRYVSSNTVSCDLTGYANGSVWYTVPNFTPSYDWGTVTGFGAGSYRWTIVCRDAVGHTASASASLRMAPLPVATFYINGQANEGITLVAGTPFTLSYQSNAVACDLAAYWNGSLWYSIPSFSPSYDWGTVTGFGPGSYRWTIVCRNATGGTTSACANLFIPPVPSATIYLNGAPNAYQALPAGSTFTLSYTSSNTTSCDLTGYANGSVWYTVPNFSTSYDWGAVPGWGAGSYSWSITCRDAWGQTVGASASLSMQ